MKQNRMAASPPFMAGNRLAGAWAMQDEQQGGDDAQHGEGLRRIGGETVEHDVAPLSIGMLRHPNRRI